MAKTLWANYSDAIKLILNGSTSKRLVGEQNIIFRNMLSRGMRDGDGNPTQNRDLEGVRIQRYCTNEEQEEYEDMYYIPDLALYMLKTFDDWDISYPPVELDYLNSLKDELGKPLFIFGSSAKQKSWEKSPIGKNHWTMICRDIEIKQEIAELDRTHHGNDPLKLESQKRMREALNKEMVEIEKKIAIFNQPNHEMEASGSKSVKNSNREEGDTTNQYQFTLNKLHEKIQALEATKKHGTTIKNRSLFIIAVLDALTKVFSEDFNRDRMPGQVNEFHKFCLSRSSKLTPPSENAFRDYCRKYEDGRICTWGSNRPSPNPAFWKRAEDIFKKM